MDGGSGLKILYASTLNKMDIPRSSLHPSKVSFYGILLGKEAMPLGRIRLNVTFGQLDNFRMERLTFKVIDFPGVYHTLLGRPCFTKFMAIPNNTYLKLKMPGLKWVITVEGSFEQAFYCEQDCVSQAVALVAPYAPNGPDHNARRAPVEEATKMAAVLDQPSIGKAVKTSSGRGGLAGPSIEVLGSLEGADLIEVSSDLSP
ncbi:uncharacterized protein [Miscanthus floridulus]|uniref:uncharacterized protein n=1 Tax=Miscanthus floridulus TaxID=154761 RepID=UPI00345A7AA4